MKKKKLYNIAFLIVFSILCSCTANKVIINIKTVDSSGLGLSNVNVKVVDTAQCCTSEDKPCTFVTNENGDLNFEFVDGKAIKSDNVKKFECEVIINKLGYKTLKESFSYCVYGPCTGTQEIKLKYKLERLK